MTKEEIEKERLETLVRIHNAQPRLKEVRKKFKRAIKSKQSNIVNVDEKIRGVGKTKTIVELAIKYKLPIITRYVGLANAIKETAREQGADIDAFGINTFVGLYSGRRRLIGGKIYLIDDVHSSDINEAIEASGSNPILIGFSPVDWGNEIF